MTDSFRYLFIFFGVTNQIRYYETVKISFNRILISVDLFEVVHPHLYEDMFTNTLRGISKVCTYDTHLIVLKV